MGGLAGGGDQTAGDSGSGVLSPDVHNSCLSACRFCYKVARVSWLLKKSRLARMPAQISFRSGRKPRLVNLPGAGFSSVRGSCIQLPTIYFIIPQLFSCIAL